MMKRNKTKMYCNQCDQNMTKTSGYINIKEVRLTPKYGIDYTLCYKCYGEMME